MSRKYRVVAEVEGDNEARCAPKTGDQVSIKAPVALFPFQFGTITEVTPIMSADDVLMEIEKELSVALEWRDHPNELAAIEAARIERMRETIVRYRASQEKP